MAKKTVKEVPEKTKKARITLECSPEIRKAIRIRAAQDDKSMNDFILSIVIERLEETK
jgi:uncharacterized protein (DUF1778 family)